jgi:uncharacterized membrane protein
VSLFWVAVVVALTVVVVRLVGRQDNSGSALDVLKQRLANGEITPDEYERDRHLLTS